MNSNNDNKCGDNASQTFSTTKQEVTGLVEMFTGDITTRRGRSKQVDNPRLSVDDVIGGLEDCILEVTPPSTKVVDCCFALTQVCPAAIRGAVTREKQALFKMKKTSAPVISAVLTDMQRLTHLFKSIIQPLYRLVLISKNCDKDDVEEPEEDEKQLLLDHADRVTGFYNNSVSKDEKEHLQLNGETFSEVVEAWRDSAGLLFFASALVRTQIEEGRRSGETFRLNQGKEETMGYGESVSNYLKFERGGKLATIKDDHKGSDKDKKGEERTMGNKEHCPALGKRCKHAGDEIEMVCELCNLCVHVSCMEDKHLCLLCFYTDHMQKKRKKEARIADMPEGCVYFACGQEECSFARELNTETEMAKDLEKVLVEDKPDARGRCCITLASAQDEANNKKRGKERRLIYNLDFITARKHCLNCILRSHPDIKKKEDIVPTMVPMLYRDRRIRNVENGDEGYREWKALSIKERRKRQNETCRKNHARSMEMIKECWKNEQVRKLMGWKKQNMPFNVDTD